MTGCTGFTLAQQGVIRGMLSGESTQQTAMRLERAVSTLHWHQEAIRRSLGVSDRMGVVIWAHHHSGCCVPSRWWETVS